MSDAVVTENAVESPAVESDVVETPAKKPRVRAKREPKAAVDPKPATDPAMALARDEAALIAKYPSQRIKTGSLAPVGAFPEFGNKRTIVILCQATGAERRIATSDLHQVRFSKEHVESLKTAASAAAKVKREEAKAAAAPKPPKPVKEKPVRAPKAPKAEVPQSE